jgi:hypothetical protein
MKDVLNRLSDARPASLDPDPAGRGADPAAIMAHARPTGGRAARFTTRRLLLAGLVPTGAAVAAVAVFATVGGGAAVPTETEPATGPTVVAGGPAPRTARDLLLVAAERTASNAETSGRYWVMNKVHGEVRQVGPAGRRYDIMLRLDTEEWLATQPRDRSLAIFQRLGAAPITAADKAAWRADGKPDRWTEPAVEGFPAIVHEAAAGPRGVRPMEGHTSENNFVLGGVSITAAELADLPTEPAALRSWLVKRLKDTGSTEPGDYSLFWNGLHLLHDLPVSPQVRAAAYRMFADIKGVTFLGGVTDQRGRSGLAVAYAHRGDGGSVSQTRLIVDPLTGRALAQESWNLGGSGSAGGSARLVGYDVLVRAEFTDEAPPTR